MKRLYLFTLFLSLFITSNIHTQIGIKGGFAAAGGLDNKLKYIHLGFAAGVTYDFTESFRAEVLVEGVYSSAFEGAYLSSYFGTLGADYRFFDGKIRPFIGCNLGLVTENTKIDNIEVDKTIFSDNYFTVHPKIGMNVRITSNILIDITLKHHIIFNKFGESLKTTRIFGTNLGLIYVFN